MINNPLFDIDFLTKLSKNRFKETYARITSLSWDENPLERIEGKITAGTVNIDGSSAVRRTCSLTMIAENVDINNYYWGLKTKFNLEIGIKNTINLDYPDIIWFPQGIYIITAFNSSISTNNYTISISGKDKMCMLNGDLGGSLYASIDFGVEEFYDKENNITYYNKIPIKTIIKNAIHIYGNEPLHNIIVSDVDDQGVELLEYRGDNSTPLFLFREVDSDFYINMSLNKNQVCWVLQENGNWSKATIGTIENVNGIYDSRVNVSNVIEGTEIRLNNNDNATRYKIHKIIYGDTTGYRLTDLTYPGDLISNVGESLTSVLDKIKTMLGDFEYFYDVNGKFIFQKKKIYLKDNWNSLIKRDDDMYVESAAYTTALAYNFTDSHYFTALSHTPALNNLKNDFSVWGKRKSVGGVDIPVHIRYAIDKKPYVYSTISISEEESKILIDEYKFSFTPSKEAEINPILLDQEKKNKYKQTSVKYTDENYDWREIIYRMALDYFKYNQYDYFQKKVAEANANYQNPAGYIEDLYPLGYTGYEIYYTDLQGFWRELYNPNVLSSSDNKQKPQYGKTYYEIDDQGNFITKIANEEFNNSYENYFKTIANLIPKDSNKKYYKFENGGYRDLVADFKYGEEYYIKLDNETFQKIDLYTFKNDKIYYWQEDEDCDINTKWNYKVNENPELLNFWFDFIGEGSELDKYMICNIGDRSKSINDSNVTGIYFKETPNVLFITNDEYVALAGQVEKTGYTYIRINDTLSNFFSISAQGKSAHEVIETLLYENTYCIENVQITSIPIYHLDANIRVEVHDRESNIDGEYIISKITLPLTYNGTMSLTASKAVDTIY